MSFNLIDAAKGLFTNDLIVKASSYLGESETGVNKAIAGIIPSFLGGVTEKASSDEGANLVANAAREAASPTFLGTGNFFDNNSGGFLSKGEGLLNNLLGRSRSGLLSGIISRFSGVKSSSASSLLSMAAPLILGFLGRHATSNNLDARGLSSFLNSQKSNINSAIPAGLNLDSFLGGVSSQATETVGNVRHTASKTESIVDDAGSGAKILLPLLLLVALAAVIFWFTKDGCSKKADTVVTTADTIATDTATEGVTSNVSTGIGRLDTATGDFIYDLGENVTLDLPNGEKLNVGRNSTEYKLVTFLNDKSAVIDTAKGNWFEFTNVRFNTGGSDITENSMEQLKNLVTISKAYPSAQFKIGGYTDNTGNASANVTLSQRRADAVAAMLKKLGISGTAIESAKGYGQEWPIADNATPEGRAQNRRVAVNVKSK